MQFEDRPAKRAGRLKKRVEVEEEEEEEETAKEEEVRDEEEDETEATDTGPEGAEDGDDDDDARGTDERTTTGDSDEYATDDLDRRVKVAKGSDTEQSNSDGDFDEDSLSEPVPQRLTSRQQAMRDRGRKEVRRACIASDAHSWSAEMSCSMH